MRYIIPSSGGSGAVNYITGIPGEDIAIYDTVCIFNNLIYKADNSIATRQPAVGIALGTALIGTSINVQIYGEITNIAWNFILDGVIYLGVGGSITQTAPITNGKYVQRVGVRGKNNQTLYINCDMFTILL